jgi:hypothetical protein
MRTTLKSGGRSCPLGDLGQTCIKVCKAVGRMWRGIQSFRGRGEKFGTVLTREAGAARRLPVRHFTSVAGSSRARSSSYREHFVNAAEPAWNVPCPWHGHSCRGSRRQRDATSLRIRDVPPPCCVRLSWCFLIASRGMSATEHMVPLRSIHNPAMVVEQRKVVKGSIMLSLLWNLSVKCPYFHCCSL